VSREAGRLSLDLPPRRVWDPRPILARASRRVAAEGPDGLRRAVRALGAALLALQDASNPSDSPTPKGAIVQPAGKEIP